MSVEPTIHQTKVFYLRCTPKVLDGRHGCVHRPARVQYIIHQHYFFVLYNKINKGGRCLQWLFSVPVIISVKGNVQFSILGHHLFIEFFQPFHQKIGEDGSSVLDTNQTGILKVAMIFDQLVAKPVDCE